MLEKPVQQPFASGSLPFASGFSALREIGAVADVELRKLFRDPAEVLSRAIQPILWLVVFGQVMGRTHAIPTGGVDYIAFMTPGILAQSVLFSAIFYGIAVIWERDLGIIHKLLVSPASRVALVLGKAISAGFRGLVQTLIIFILAGIMRIELRWSLWPMLLVLLSVMLGSAIFSAFSLIIACVVRTRERFMGIGQVLTMPLFFASNAIYPLTLMPSWLQLMARLNPLTYLVEILRTFMVGEPAGVLPNLALDFTVLGIIFIGLILIAARLYPSLAQ